MVDKLCKEGGAAAECRPFGLCALLLREKINEKHKIPGLPPLGPGQSLKTLKGKWWGFELWISGAGGSRSTNCATTIVQNLMILLKSFLQWNCYQQLLRKSEVN